MSEPKKQVELPLPEPEARRPTVSTEELHRFLRMYQIMSEEDDEDRCRAIYLAAIIKDLINAKAESAAKDAELETLRARVERLEAELDKGDSWTWIRAKFEKCRTQFAWYTPRKDSLVGTRYEVMGWLHVLFAHADPKVYIDITMEHQEMADQANKRAESSEARLRAVSEALEEIPNDLNFMSEWIEQAKLVFARLRAIVESK